MSKAAELANLIGNINAGGGGVNRNLVINGAMNVAQRGTSSTSAGFQTVDRFKSGVQTVGITQSQESLSSGEPFEKGFTKFYRQTVTSPSNATNVIMEVKHSIEAQNIANSGWDFKNANRPLSLSFYARSSVAGTYYSYVRNTDASPEQFYRFSFVLSANTWTKVEKTIAGNSNLVFPNDNGEGLAIFWVPAFGTNYSGSSVNLDQWETLTGSDYIPDITHAWGNTNGATFDLTGVQLEVGQNPTEFEHEPFSATLHKCYRYFYATAFIGTGVFNSDSQCLVSLNPPNTFRAAPNVSMKSGGFTNINVEHNDQYDISGVAFGHASNEDYHEGINPILTISMPSRSGYSGNAGLVGTDRNDDAFFFSAEL